ncbi:[NiFe]-hydrogenase assembly chaperone HybE [Bradyrhizobium sp. BR 1432]|uniref:[NiFe]-hydrogenase assembly chaperone HybE n=1 Tax=Bradyrhizobium sp. BR 1432 TaxID=3447966 RepID=UPI003EE5C924
MVPDTQTLTADADPRRERVADAYRATGLRAMRDASIRYDALGVEAVGFRPFSTTIIGIMVAPGYTNAVMPRDEITRAASGSSLLVHLPTGTIELALSEVALIASCSLFSPMFDYADLAVARAAEGGRAELSLPADCEEAVCCRAPAIGRIVGRNFLRGVLTELRA